MRPKASIAYNKNMSIKLKFLSAFLSCCLLCQSTLPAWAAANANKAELLRLQTQAKQILAKRPDAENYIRQILLLSAETVLLTALANQSQKRLALAFVSAKKESVFSAPRAPLTAGKQNRMLFAKKSKIELTGNLFDQQPPAPPKKDLSWLDRPNTPLTPKPQQPALFDMPPAEVTPKTFLSKRILKKYEIRISRLPLAEKQALIETLDEAVLRQKANGRYAAWEFLEKKAFQSSSTSFYLIIAQRMLWAMSILLIVGFFMHPASETMTQRLAENPALFLDASEEELEQLSHHPQAVDFAKSIVQTIDVLAQSLPASADLQDIPDQLPPSFVSPAQLAR